MPEKKLIGEITHYFTNIGVGIIKLSDKLEVNDKISIEGASTDIQQTVDSMEIDRDRVEEAGKGESIGLKVKDRVREGDKVYKMSE
ncbi:MAG: translation elongation factor-like protein [Candidatus Aenigmatarchaeota archaeon]